MSVLFIKPSQSSFVKIDEEILRKHFQLQIFQLENKSKPRFFLSLFRLVFFMVFQSGKYEVAFTRFADYHSALMVFLARILRKKSIVVIGGYDVYCIPEYSYGAHFSWFRGIFSRYVLRKADLLLPVSKALIFSENSYASERTVKAGIRYYAPNTRAKIQLLYNGFKPEIWLPAPEKELMVVTVAYMNDLITFKMKGMDDYIQAARDLSSIRFVFIGVTPEFRSQFIEDLPSNLELLPPVSNTELLFWFGRAKVFCILSLSEGMPNVLCEAMLCGCIPVGSNVDPIPEIIGDSGFVVLEKNREKIAYALQSALDAPEELGIRARKRVETEYNYEKREEGLKNAILGIIKSR